jgi:hypothetical protein
MISVDINLKVFFRPEDLPNVYLNEEVLSEAITENLTASLERMDAKDVVFRFVDIEGLE